MADLMPPVGRNNAAGRNRNGGASGGATIKR
jgi:hypothetical protein